MTLFDKISEIEAFERTPVGAALKRFRSAIQVAVLEDEKDAPAPGAWTKTREAELTLMTEIKRLQDELLDAQDLLADVEKFIAAVAPTKLTKELASIRHEIEGRRA